MTPRLAGLVRVVHPFPSVLDGLVVGAVALVADAALWPTAIVLGLSMTSLQASIGALNDVVDAPRDVGRIPPKPIPAGLVSPLGGRVLMVAAASIGLALAATFGAGLLALAGLVLVIGYAYDLVAKGTAWSWLPFATGIPILPVFGWFGATGALPGWALALVPAGAFAGAALAIANAWADERQDRASGVETAVTRLGERGSRAALVGAWAVAAAIALGWLLGPGTQRGSGDPVPVAFLAAVGVVVGGVAVGWTGSPERREWGWRIQAAGAGAAAVTWLLAVAGQA